MSFKSAERLRGQASFDIALEPSRKTVDSLDNIEAEIVSQTIPDLANGDNTSSTARKNDVEGIDRFP